MEMFSLYDVLFTKTLSGICLNLFQGYLFYSTDLSVDYSMLQIVYIIFLLTIIFFNCI